MQVLLILVFLLEDVSEERDIFLLSPDEADIKETKLESSKIQNSTVPITNISDEDKFKQIKDDLICSLRAELKNMLEVNEIDAD